MAYAVSFYIASFVISLINPFIGFVGLTCSVLIRFQDRYPDIVIIKPFMLLFMGLLVGCYLHRDKLARAVWKQDKLLLYMLLVSAIGLLVMSPGDLIGETWSFFCSLGFYFFATRLLQKQHHFIILFFAMAACITFLGYEAIESVAIDPLKSTYIDKKTGRWQGIGYYSNSNEFGQLMITVVPFLLGIVLLRKSLVLSIVAIGMMGLMIFVMGKTLSRTCMATLGLMIIMTFALRGSGNVIKKMIVAGIVGCLLVGVLSVVPGPIRDRFNTIGDTENDESFQGRLRSWGYGVDMVIWYPLTGVGKGQWLQHHGLAPHNSYVQIMAELGPAGIGLFIWVLALSFKEFKPILLPESSGGKGEQKKTRRLPKKTFPQISDTSEVVRSVALSQNKKRKLSKFEAKETSAVPNSTKTIAIAVLSIFVGFLVYIFLGNQGYGVWTYFYIGACCAIRNLLPIETPKKVSRRAVSQSQGNKL